VEQLGEVWTRLSELGRAIDDGGWRSATPCPGWDVAAQYAHVIGTESMLLGRPNPPAGGNGGDHVRNPIGEFNEVWVAHLAGRSRTEVLDIFDEVTGARRAALATMTDEDFAAPSWTPVGEADYGRFMQVRTFDCWVHEQDVRDAVGLPGGGTGPAAEQAVDEIVRAAGFVVGKKAGVGSGSSVRFRLTGPLERTIDVEVSDKARVVAGLGAAPTVTLGLSSDAYVRLACGRTTGEDVLAGALGGVSIEGDRETGRRVLANMAFVM
jgi:uncharacterized protein (TIGR03083 family)